MTYSELSDALLARGFVRDADRPGVAECWRRGDVVVTVGRTPPCSAGTRDGTGFPRSEVRRVRITRGGDYPSEYTQHFAPTLRVLASVLKSL